MFDKRKSKRLTQENEITIKIISKEKLPPDKKTIYHISKDISSSGARIQANVFLPVDTLIKIQLNLKDPPRMVTALGKVKWIRSLYGDESYEAGLEFVDTSSETIQLLADHVDKTMKVKSLG
jgi:hypothetical protein